MRSSQCLIWGPPRSVKLYKAQSCVYLCRKECNASRPRAPPLLTKQPQRKRELTWEERFFEEYKPPNLVPNKYILVAGILIAISLAVYSTTL